MFLVLPCLLLGYLGQAAYLMDNHAGAEQSFFSSIPSKLHLLSPPIKKIHSLLSKWDKFLQLSDFCFPDVFHGILDIFCDAGIS